MIRKEDCEFSTTWNPTPPNNTFIHINDWNLTLFTKIVDLSSQIHRSTCVVAANKIIANPHMREFFESLGFYNINYESIGAIKVIYNDECERNVIYVYNDRIEKSGHVYYEFVLTDDVTPTLTPTFNPQTIQRLKKYYCGYIEITYKLKFLKKNEPIPTST